MVENVSADDIPRIASELGEIRVDPRSPDPIRDIRPQMTADAKPNTLSSRYGTSSFPFHTDVAHWHDPARYVLLYCVHPGSGNRPTQLQDSRTWDLEPGVWRAMLREVWKSGHFRPHLCTVGTQKDDRIALRFDVACMSPMTTKASQVKTCIDECLRTSRTIEISWQPRTLLAIDNSRMLHARGESKCSDPDRVLRRALIGR